MREDKNAPANRGRLLGRMFASLCFALACIMPGVALAQAGFRFSTTVVDFNSVAVDAPPPQNHADRAFTITNTGTEYLWGLNIRFDNSQFTFLSSTCGSGLYPGQSCSVSVRYTPLNAGEFWGSNLWLGLSPLQYIYPLALTGRSYTLNNAPSSPIMGSATGGNASATVTFSAPASSGSSSIIGYTAISNPAGGTGSCYGAGCRSITLNGLSNGTSYTFTVSAYNSVGAGPASAESNAVTPGVLPSAPTISSVTTGYEQATVYFTAPTTIGASAITGYTATCGSRSASASASPITVGQLTGRVAVNCTVTASNANGTGPSSSPVSVTPLAVVPPSANYFSDAGLVNGIVRSELPNGKGSGGDWLTLHYSNYTSEWWYMDYSSGYVKPMDQWFGCMFSPRGVPHLSGLGVSFTQDIGCPGYRAAPDIYGGPDPRREMYGYPYWFSGQQQRNACGGGTDVSNVVGDSWKTCINYKSNTFYSNGGTDPGQYWMIHANTDPSFDQCNEGPPTRSYFVTDPLSDPSPNLFKVGMEPLANGKKRAHIIVAPGQHDFACATNPSEKPYKIPFLSVGAEVGHGNAAGLGAYYWTSNSGQLPTPRPHLRFNARLYGVEPIGCKPGDDGTSLCKSDTTGYYGGFYIHTSWNGVGRLLFVKLVQENLVGNGKSNWNWPIEESAFYPGAEGLFLTADYITQVCGINVPNLPKPLSGVGSAPSQSYDIDLVKLLNCAIPPAGTAYNGIPTMFSNPPTSEGAMISISGIHWFVELNGTSGSVWMTFDDPQLVYQ